MTNFIYRTLRGRPMAWGLVALTALSMQGCGGCGCGGPHLHMERISPDSEPGSDLVEAPVAPKPKQKITLAAIAAPIRLPDMPQRPPDFAQWTVDDFLTAHEDADPGLPQAAAFLGKSAATNEESLWLLTRLLEHKPASAQRGAPSNNNNNDEDVRRPATTAGPSGKVAAVILPILCANPSLLARSTLEQVLRGTLPVDMTDALAVETICKAMLLQNNPDSEALLYQLLTAPEKWRAADDERLTADALQSACFKLVQPVASPAFRARMAQHLVAHDTPPSHREKFGEWLASTAPDNLPAQIVLHNSDLLSSAAKTRFREVFARQNSQALDQLLGTTTTNAWNSPKPAVPANNSPPGLFISSATQPVFAGDKSKPLDPVLEIARLLWTPDFIDTIAVDLAQVRDLGSDRELMLLACNLPYAKVRTGLHHVLLRHWDQGVAPFESARLTFDSIRDPGFLLLAKAMPREEVRPTRPGAPQIKPSAESAAKQAWMAASQQFLQSLNARFYTAAHMNPGGKVPGQQASTAVKEPGDRTGSDDSELLTAGLPFPVHKGATVVAEYHVKWPTELHQQLPDVPATPLVLHYVRLEGEEKFAKVSEWYKRQVKGSVARNLPRGQWLDGVQHDAKQHSMRSVDVLISRATDQPLVATSPPESLTVEILWIEIPDPTGEIVATALGGRNGQ